TEHVKVSRTAIYTCDFSFITNQKNVENGQLRMKNKLEPYVYAGEFRYETDCIDLDEVCLQVEGLDFFNYFQHGAIYAEKLKIADMRIVIFRDKRKPDDMDRRPAMIHEIFRELPIPLDIEEVEVANGYVSYEERPESGAPRTGKIF